MVSDHSGRVKPLGKKESPIWPRTFLSSAQACAPAATPRRWQTPLPTGARAAGHTVEVISLRGKNIAFCRGCLACQTLGRCVIDDDTVAITEKMQHADVIVFATPIYYYEMSGQLKTLLDRANALFPSDYAFRDIYLLASATEDEPDTDERAIHGLEGWIACYEKVPSRRDGVRRRRDGAGRHRRPPRTRDRPRRGRGHRIKPVQEVKSMNSTLTLTQEWDKTFPQNAAVDHCKVTFSQPLRHRARGRSLQTEGARRAPSPPWP